MTLPPYPPSQTYLFQSHLDPADPSHPALDSVGQSAGAAVRAEMEARILESRALLTPSRPGIRARLRAWLPAFRIWLRAMPLP